MKKILFLITQGEMGGAQRYVYDLATNLDKSQFDITVAHGSGDDSLSKKLEDAGIQTKILKNLKRNISPVSDILAFFEIYKYLKKEKPDIIHLNSSKAGAIGSVASKMANIKTVIYTAHGWAFEEPGILKKIIYWKVEFFTSFFKDKIICVSENDYNIALKFHVTNKEKLITIHNGISLSALRPTPYALRSDSHDLHSDSHDLRSRAREQMSELLGRTILENDVVFGTIAHNYKNKDLKTLYSASEIVNKECPDSIFFIAGKGSRIGPVEKQNLIAGFDIYVMSSVKEGFPYSILDSLSFGIPSVSTAVGGIPEAIKNNIHGFLVAPKNPEGLAKKIIELIKNKNLRHSMSLACIEQAKKFSLDECLQKTKKLYS